MSVIFLQGRVTALHIASYNNMMESVIAILNSASKTDKTIDIQDEVRSQVSMHASPSPFFVISGVCLH